MPEVSKSYAFERRNPSEQGPDFARIIESFKASGIGSRFGKGLGGLWVIILAVAIVLWLASGIYQVDPSEQAVVRIFGAATAPVGPGLHWKPPAPIASVDLVRVLERKRMEVGFRGSEPFPLEALMITGDTNIVDIEMLVQYEIKDIVAFLFGVWDPGDRVRDISDTPDGRTLKDGAEASLRQVVGSRPIDDVLTTNRPLVESETKELLQELLDLYGTGIRVVQVQLQAVRPPGPVQASFDDVVSAREDKERMINLAQAYENDIIPKARGEAEKMVNDAEAFSASRVAEAQGEASRFLQVLEEYQKAKAITRQRLYLETIEAVLPGVKKFIVSPDSAGNLVQFLPLEGVDNRSEIGAVVADAQVGAKGGSQ